MNHEIVGPENQMIGRREASDLAMPGQLRIARDIARAHHIEQFDSNRNYFGPSNYERRDSALRHVAKHIGVPYEIIEPYTWAQHNLIWELHMEGNDVAAQAIARDISLTERSKVIHTLMNKVAALLIYERLDEWGHDGLNDDELTPILKEIVKTNADYPVYSDKWQKALKDELRGLTRKDIHWSDGIAMSGTVEHWEIDKENLSART